jgi:HAE1 family hydrophobic/amphiphilic exporter-1
MNISAPFIRRPIASSLIAVALLAIGIICFLRLPVAPVPDVNQVTYQISAQLPGASPETMASNVATPLERQFSKIPSVSQMTSSSSNGSTSVTLQFELGKNEDTAAQEVQSAISAAAGQLPTNLPSPPTMRKVNPTDNPVIVIVMTSDTLPMNIVSDYADNIVLQRLSRIEGAGQVLIGSGGYKPAIRIRIDPRKVAAMGLQLDQIRAELARATANAPKGQLIGDEKNVAIYANDQVLDAGTWNEIIVAYKNGAPVRVKDLGEAILSVENTQNAAGQQSGANGAYAGLKTGQGAQVIVWRGPGANVIQLVERVKAAMPEIRAAVPQGIDMTVVADRTVSIRAAVKDVEITLMITIVLVVGVIFLFLRNVAATLIASAVIPACLFATAIIMLPAGFSLDNLTLMALTIAVGFVVDDAIVMVEAIWRRIEHGEPPMQAAMNGSKEIGMTILTISLSLIAVFTPLMFMGGVVGMMMRAFALVLSAAVVVSVILSLTLTPMLCSRFLRIPKPSTNPFIVGLERGFHRLEESYSRGLDVVLRHKPLTLVIFFCTLALTVALYATSKTGFFPQQDTGQISGTLQTAQGSSFEYGNAKALQAMQIIADDPDVDEVHYFAPQGSFNIGMSLRSREHGRRASAAQIVDRLRPKLAQVVGASIVLQAVQDISTGGRQARAAYQYTLSDSDLDELNEWAPKLVAALQKVPELKDVNSDQQSTAPSATMIIDRDAAGRFGISPTDIDNALYSQLGQRQIGQYFTQVNAYRIIMEAPPELQGSPELFNQIHIVSPRTGKPVPLSAMVKIDTSRTRSLSIAHQSMFPATTISFNISPGTPLGEATAAVERAREELGAPPSLQGSFQGTAQAFQDSLKDEPILILAALLSVYVILGVLYESYIHPLTILSTLPSAGLGALLALRLAGHDLDVIGIIAIILLIGIVKKNGIMIVDVALHLERDKGMGTEEAVREASHQRLRPILMTTACAFLGGLPMILMQGTGSEFRQPLGWAIVGGLLVSQVLTLFTTPVIYIYLDRFRRRFSKAELQPGELRPVPAHRDAAAE